MIYLVENTRPTSFNADISSIFIRNLVIKLPQINLNDKKLRSGVEDPHVR